MRWMRDRKLCSVLLGTPPAWFAQVDSPIYNLQVQAQVDLEPSPREHGTRSSLFEDVEQGPKLMLFQTKVCIPAGPMKECSGIHLRFQFAWICSPHGAAERMPASCHKEKSTPSGLETAETAWNPLLLSQSIVQHDLPE